MENRLTNEQQKLVEDNMKLVTRVVSKCYPTFLSDQEIIASGYMGLCLAALKWDESKGVFSTFAWYCVRNQIRKELRSRQKYPEAISLNTIIGDDITLEDTLESDDESEFNKMTYDEFANNLTYEERTVLDLKLGGYKVTDIEVITGLNHRDIRRIVKNIRTKYFRLR